MPVVTSTIDGHVHAVVSVNAFENVDSSLLQRAEVSFDGEGQGDRLARRQRNWIGRVAFVPGLRLTFAAADLLRLASPAAAQAASKVSTDNYEAIRLGRQFVR